MLVLVLDVLAPAEELDELETELGADALSDPAS